MTEFVAHAFAWVCGQNPAHTWVPGGLALPCCERCTGLYVGAAVAAALHSWLRPRLTGRFLEVHGLFLLIMVPFGFHWLPQGSTVRSLTGLVFGFAVVAFLSLTRSGCLPASARHNTRASAIYTLVMVATGALLPVTASEGGTAAAMVLTWLTVAGAAAMFLLVSANLVAWLAALRGLFRQRRAYFCP